MTLRHTPLFYCHVRAGARMVSFAGWEMPVQYSGVIQEHERVRTAVGLFDVSHMGEVFVRGPKALAAVQWLTTNDASALAVGQAQYSLLPNAQGGLVDDVVVYRLGESEFLICINAANRAKDVAHMLANNPHGAQISDESTNWAQVAIQGRHAAATLGAVSSGLVDDLPTYWVTPSTVAGIANCLVARTGYTGEDGFEVFVPSAHAAVLWNALLEAGAQHGIVPVGLGARDTLRLEARYPLYGHELTDQTSPWQAGLGWVTKPNKPGGFLGLEAVVARKGNAPHRLVGLRIEGKRIARDGMQVYSKEAQVGWVTSGTRSPTLQQAIALAYVQRGLHVPGTSVTIDVRGHRVSAQVVQGPFYKRDY